jgi:hypothetical protein
MAPPQNPPVTQIVVGALLPIVGVILAIVLLARGRGAHGAAVLLTSLLSFLVWSLLLGA